MNESVETTETETEAADKREMTEGEWRVGVSFNPGKNPDVDQVKAMAANLIDFIIATGKDARCTSLAATGFEEAAMWAVKSITKSPLEKE